MTSKEELQKQITDLQNEFSEKIADLWNRSNYVKEDELASAPEEYWYLAQEGWYEIICCVQAPIYSIVKGTTCKTQSHGLGRYKTREMAEAARAYLIYHLDILKKVDQGDNIYWSDPKKFLDRHLEVTLGKEIIKKLEDGTYEN